MAELQPQAGSIEAHALARHVRMSPQKARLVMDLIRGQKAQAALQTLRFTPKRAAKHIEKVLRSAIANAERKAEDAGAPLDVDELYVNNCFVNEGARWKRLRPAPMGRAFRYQKRTAHLWVGVSEHHVAAAQRVAAIEAEAEAQKGVRGTARPGIIIGRKGAEIDKLKQEVQKRTKREVHIDIQEVHRPELDAQLVAESIALQLEKRVAFRRAMRKAVDSALRFGCKGIKVRVAGRLNGAEIARKEWYLQGRLPLQTLRADIDFGFAQAYTTYGVIGVKCWVYQGENVPKRASKIQKEREGVAA